MNKEENKIEYNAPIMQLMWRVFKQLGLFRNLRNSYYDSESYHQQQFLTRMFSKQYMQDGIVTLNEAWCEPSLTQNFKLADITLQNVLKKLNLAYYKGYSRDDYKVLHNKAENELANPNYKILMEDALRFYNMKSNEAH